MIEFAPLSERTTVLRARNAPDVGEPMPARDAINYYFESERTRAAVIGAFAFDATTLTTSTGRPITDRAGAYEFVRSIADLHPMFRRRLRTVPFSLGLPHWVDTDVELTRHVFTWTAPQVGAQAFVSGKLAELSDAGFDFGFPPWQLHFVLDVRGMAGVPDGGTVVIFDFHHCAIDGMGLVEVVNKILTGPESVPGTPEPVVAVPVPGAGAAARVLPRQFGRFTRAAVRRTVAVRRFRRTAPPALADGGKLQSRPATRFNRNVGPDSVHDVTWFELSRVRRIKSSFGSVTVNDVMMTVISLGFGAYLNETGELPSATLAASIPMSTRTFVPKDARAQTVTANNLTVVNVALHTDIANPVERLLAIHASAAHAKARGEAFATQLPPNPLVVAPAPVLKVLSKMMATPAAEPKTAKINMLITNVPFGSAPLSLGGAPAVGAFGLLPPAEGIGLAHAIVTYADRLSVNVMSNAELMPDTARYVGHLQSAMNVLEQAATAAFTGPTSTASTTPAVEVPGA